MSHAVKCDELGGRTCLRNGFGRADRHFEVVAGVDQKRGPVGRPQKL